MVVGIIIRVDYSGGWYKGWLQWWLVDYSGGWLTTVVVGIRVGYSGGWYKG